MVYLICVCGGGGWELQFTLLQYLKEKFQAKHRVSVERVISGPGIGNV